MQHYLFRKIISIVYYCFAWSSWISSCQVHCATGPTFADSLALKKMILMWSVLTTSIGPPLGYTHNLLP